MLYVLQQGPTEKVILEQCLRERRPLPQAIQNAPSLMPGLELYYNAYLNLQSTRQLGWSEGPVSWLAVNEYANRLRLSDEQHDDLQYHVRRLDEAYFEHRREESKRRKAVSDPPKAPPRRPSRPQR